MLQPQVCFIRRFLLAALISLPVFLPDTVCANDIVSDMRERFDAYNDVFFQEKVYVHHDKDSYISGETIWLKAYRADAATNMPFFYSGLVYIEIHDQESRVVRRMQAIQTNSCFRLNYNIPQNWPSGNYELVAYTNWMQNYDEDFYFRKSIYIHNVNEALVNVDVEYIPSPDKNEITVEVKFTDRDGMPYNDRALEMQLFSGNEIVEDLRYLRTNRDGIASHKFKLDDGITSMSLAFDNNNPLEYKRYFKLPVFDSGIDVKFMPEGGHMLAGMQQKVAFKAVGVDGTGVDVKGVVVDDNGNEVAEIETTHLGMGQFVMKAAAGVEYTANLTSADGRKASVRLPDAVPDGVAISAEVRGGALLCKVLSTNGYDFSDMYMGVHQRGKALYWEELTRTTELRLPLGDLPEGILHCFVVDGDGKVYSERLVMINNDMTPEVKVGGLKSSYAPRQKVEVELDVALGNTPLPADLSVSVIDTKQVMVDRSENIVSYMLMSSDIKGRVENAAYYFDRSVLVSERAHNADILMMTQAWRRFDIGGVVRKELPDMPYSLELGQSISGKLTRRFSKKAPKDGMLAMYGVKDSKAVCSRRLSADENGEFCFNDISFPDKTIFFINGTHKKNKSNVTVEVHEQEFRASGYKNRDIIVMNVDQSKGDDVVGSAGRQSLNEGEEFYRNNQPKYFYVNGEKIRALQEVVVTAERSAVWEEWEEEARRAKYKTTLDEMLENRHYSVRDWVLSIPGVRIEDNDDDVGGYETIYYRGRKVRVHVPRGEGGYRATTDDVLNMPVSQVKTISLNIESGPSANIAIPVSTPTLFLEVNSPTGMSGVRPNKLGRFEFVQMGYSEPDDFYAPDYSRNTFDDYDYDERVTVHWVPDVKVGEDGKAKISFYTTDMNTEYRMIIQGMAVNGMPIYKDVGFANNK